MKAIDYAELLEDDTLSPLQRALFESELRRAMKREEQYASMSAEARASATTHHWQQKTLQVARALLALRFEIDAWERRESRPYGYDDTLAQLRHKGQGFKKRLARLRREAAAGNAQQQKWMEDHAELLAAISRDA